MAKQQVLTVPYEIVWHDQSPLVVMAKISSDKIHGAFWDPTLARHAKRSAIISLDQVELDGSERAFVGSIFHITRCGSTSLLKQFDAFERIFGLSEPFIFQQLLHSKQSDCQSARQRIVKLACLFAKGLAPVADQIVVKWPTLLCRHVELVETSLGQIASVFLYRDPVEVLGSIEARPLGNMTKVSPELLFGPDEPINATPGLNDLTLTATLLAANCRWIARSRQVRKVGYAQLPEVGWHHVAPMFGIQPSPDQIASMMRSSNFDAKRPKILFSGDSMQKQMEASLSVRKSAETILLPALQQALEALLPIAE